MKKVVARLTCSVVLLSPAAAIAQSAASDFTSGTRYDLAHRITGTIAPDPDGPGSLHHLAVRYTYDGQGRLVKVENGELSSWQSEAITPASWSGFTPHLKVETIYDLLDRKVKETVSGWNVSVGAWDAPTAVSQYSYDRVGRLQCAAVRMDPALFGSLPASACDQSDASNPIDRITSNVYDDASQLVQVRKAKGTPIEQAYVSYSYTPNGKQEYITDANGNKARLTYDGHDRQAQWQFPSASTLGTVNTNDYEEYGYDLNGNRTSARKRDGRVFGFTYDNLNRMTVKAVPDACVSGYACTNVPSSMTRDVYYAYDARGLQTSARFDGFSGTDAVISGYDGFGRLTRSTTSMGGVSRTLNYLYDANSNRIRVTHPDGNYVDYNREGLDRIYTVYLNGTVPLLYLPYDAHGRVSALYRLVSGNWNNYTAYGYDTISRLTSLASVLTSSSYNVAETFAYNAASQVVTRTRDNNLYAFNGYTSVNRSYTPNGLNQYASVSGNSYGYDSNGNLTADGVNAYTYDAENRLVVTSAGAQLTYDPLGRLYETYTASTGMTRFLYDGDQLTAEYDGSGNLLRRYVHSDGADDPLVWYEGANVSSPRYLYRDHQGSITAVTDASGNAIAVNSYDEYGVPGSGNSGRFQYTGQAWIPELGMYHYKARIYSPMLGRFMQTDPIGYEDQINLYAYVGNDPMNKMDPAGTHGRDSSWAGRDKEWDKYDAAQKAAAGRYESAAGRLEAGGKGAGKDFEKVFGKGSATPENMKAVAATMREMASALRDDGSGGHWATAETASQFAASGHAGADAYNEIGGSQMHVNIEGSRFNDKAVLTWIVGHEVGHGVGLVHPRVGGITPYVLGATPEQIQAYKSLDTPARLRNPDKFMSFASGGIPSVE